MSTIYTVLKPMIFHKVCPCCHVRAGSLFFNLLKNFPDIVLKNRRVLSFCDITAAIYFPHADTSLVWLPSDQRQPPVHGPSCIYTAIITKRDLKPDCVSYLQRGRSLPVRNPEKKKKLQDTKQIENMQCCYKISNHLVKTESKRNSPKKKTI